MIHVFIGTKAQFIKMAPVMRELDHRGIEYNFVDSGQHARLTGAIAREFGLRCPDVFLRRDDRSISTATGMLRWTVGALAALTVKPRRAFQHVFRGERGICLVHGDTATTLVSVLYAKRCALQVAHVEAGLRSYRLLDPFPEEIIRLLTMRLSDVLFSPSLEAVENLRRLGYESRTVYTGANTIADAVRYAVQQTRDFDHPQGPYVVLTAHRVETIYSRSRMETVIGLAEHIARERKVVFVQHDPTRRQLRRFGLYERIARNPDIEELPLQPYLAFVGLLARADFVVTDGGSIQEECSYLGVPCLIIRSATERDEGIGENAVLSCFDADRTDRFLRDYETMRTSGRDVAGCSPSGLIVDYLQPYVE